MERFTTEALEFTQVKRLIQQEATSKLGQERIMQIMPSPDRAEVERRLQETEEASAYLRLHGEFPLRGFRDITNSLQRVEHGGWLQPTELLEIVGTLAASRQARQALIKEESYLLLQEVAGQIVSFPKIERSIQDCIDEEGRVKDHASQKLRQLRRDSERLRQRIQQTLQQILQSRSMQKMLQETIVTQRYDRYVIPVKQEYRSSLDGIVHDQSASGATVFIEPAAIVALNNELRSKELEEEQEIERILKVLSAEVATIVEELRINVEALTQLDVAFAKARFAHSRRGVCPVLTTSRRIKLRQARHPLLSEDRVVPIDVEMDDEIRAILITGPNTGGKTVSLKTVGLFALMTQSGFPILAEEESVMPLYSGVYADIGDEQSIEQSLSTFSAHMTHVIHILQQIDANSLVLFDELGSGTDPTEGAALAISILERVLEIGSTMMVTTHYSECKLFADAHPAALNASVEFDLASLKPTYRLLLGVPGQSHAFYIVKRLGLPIEIVERAEQSLSSENRQLEKMIQSYTVERQQWAEKHKQAEQILQESQKLHQEIVDQWERLEQQKERLREKAKEEARQIVSHAEHEAEAVLSQLRRWIREGGTQLKEHQLIESKKRLQDAAPETAIAKKTVQMSKQENSFSSGDEVEVVHIGQKGTIIEASGEGTYLVQIGAMKMKVAQTQLRKRRVSKETRALKSTTLTRKHETVKTELDLRGKHVEEALSELDRYLDQAMLNGYQSVSIIHGKGTGVLRTHVHQYLQQHRHVRDFRLGVHGEGGSGVTIVQL